MSSTPFMVRLPTELREPLGEAAKAEDRSVNNTIVRLVRVGLESRGFIRPHSPSPTTTEPGVADRTFADHSTAQ